MSEPKKEGGPLMASVASLSEGGMDIDKKSKRLTSELDSLLSTYLSREKLYTSAVEHLQKNYDDIIKEAETEASRLHDVAVEEAKDIVAAAKKETAEWEAEKERLSVIQKYQPRINLNVGGIRFTTSLTTLRRFPDTMIGAMFSGRHALPLEADDHHFIDRDGTHFRYILNFLRSPESFQVGLTGTNLSELRSECDYYGLLDLMFPFTPIPSFSAAAVYGQLIKLTQAQDGIWKVNKIPIQVCPHCDVADFEICKYPGLHATYCYFNGFSALIAAKGGIISPDQPKITKACKSCQML